MPNPLSSNMFGTTPTNVSAPTTNGIPQNVSNNIAHIKNIMSMLKASSNPQEMIQQVAKHNPQLNQVIQLCNGKNPEQVFRELCKQQNIDADEFIKMLQ